MFLENCERLTHNTLQLISMAFIRIIANRYQTGSQMCLHTRIRNTARRPETRRPTKSFCSASLKRKPILPPTRIEKPMPRVMPSKKARVSQVQKRGLVIMAHVQTFTVHPSGGFGRLASIMSPTPRTSTIAAASAVV